MSVWPMIATHAVARCLHGAHAHQVDAHAYEPLSAHICCRRLLYRRQLHPGRPHPEALLWRSAAASAATWTLNTTADVCPDTGASFCLVRARADPRSLHARLKRASHGKTNPPRAEIRFHLFVSRFLNKLEFSSPRVDSRTQPTNWRGAWSFDALTGQR